MTISVLSMGGGRMDRTGWDGTSCLGCQKYISHWPLQMAIEILYSASDAGTQAKCPSRPDHGPGGGMDRTGWDRMSYLRCILAFADGNWDTVFSLRCRNPSQMSIQTCLWGRGMHRTGRDRMGWDVFAEVAFIPEKFSASLKVLFPEGTSHNDHRTEDLGHPCRNLKAIPSYEHKRNFAR